MKFSQLILIYFFCLLLTACTNSGLDQRTILFYGNTCPHCKDLDGIFEKFKISEKFQFEHLEVYDNKVNSNLLGAAALECGIKTDSIGVPFLFTEKKCYIGNPEILKYVSEKTGIDFEASESANTE